MIDFLVYLLTMIGIWSILSISLNVQYGLTGLINLGHVAFFMIGAYVTTILVMLLGLPFWVGFIGALLIAGLFGALISLPTANLREDYWAISTLAFAEIVRLFFLNQPLKGPYIGASFGVSGIPAPFRDFFSTQGYNYFFLLLVLLCLAGSYFIAQWFTKKPFGRVLKAIREGDHLPLALGKNVGSFRVRSMFLSGALGGCAGFLFAHYNGFISPQYFLPLETFLVWAMVILGGSGNYKGAILGTIVIQAIYNSTRFISKSLPIEATTIASMRMIIIGILIILVILYMPQGLLPEKKRRYYHESNSKD